MKRLLVVLLLLLGGCQTAPQQLSLENLDRSATLAIEDARPSSEREKATFSHFIHRPGYGILRMGDEVIQPGPVRLFQHRAHQQLPDLSSSTRLKIHHFVVYANMQATLRQQAVTGPFGGLVAAIVAVNTQPFKSMDAPRFSSFKVEDFESLAQEEYKRAYYSTEENPGHGSVLVVYIDTEINGQRTATRTISPYEKTGYVRTLEAAIDAHLRNYPGRKDNPAPPTAALQ
jgi:hypothetical protein